MAWFRGCADFLTLSSSSAFPQLESSHSHQQKAFQRRTHHVRASQQQQHPFLSLILLLPPVNLEK
jgi:hypothetical protein